MALQSLLKLVKSYNEDMLTDQLRELTYLFVIIFGPP